MYTEKFLQRQLDLLSGIVPTSHRQILGVIRAMDTIDFASVCFWWGQIAAENAYVIYQN